MLMFTLFNLKKNIGSTIAICILAHLLLLTPVVYGQTVITGKVIDTDQVTVPFANVQLLVASDSSFSAGTIANEEGGFRLENVDAGEFLLLVSLIGFQDNVIPLPVEPGARTVDLGFITLSQGTIEMDEVSVVARRTLYEQQSDRIVINVGTSVTLSGSTALQILERSPGVIVDQQNGTISMLGKDGVQLMINGKMSYMPATALVQFLSSINSDNVESIELITTPPSSIDAEGNAGFINIELKRNLNLGLNGSFTLSAGYGRGERTGNSIDFNYQQGKTSVFGSYALNWNGQEQFIGNYRRLNDNGNILEYPTESVRQPNALNHNVRLGIDYDIHPKIIIGGLVSAYNNRWSMDAENTALFSSNSLPINRVISTNDETNRWRNFMSNANIRYNSGSGTSLSMDIDYLRYQNENPTNYFNVSTDLTDGSITQNEVGSDKSTPLNILVSKIDYKRILDNGWEFETGIKGALANFTNQTTYNGLQHSSLISLVGLTSHSTLDENTFAVYGSTKYKPGEKTSIGVGLRYEFTDSNLDSNEDVDLVDRKIGEFFPTLTLDHKLSDQLSLGASYNRRITRPSFRDLAPFVYFLNPQTFFTGNTALRPAIINTTKLDLSYKSIFASASYSWEDGTISRFQWVVVPEENVQIFFPDNLKGTNTFTGLVAIPFEVASWWTTQNNITAISQRLEGNRNGMPIVVEQSYLRLNSTQTFQLPQDFVLELTGFYQGASTFGTAKMKAFSSVNLGLQRALRNGRLSFAVNDVFDTLNYEAVDGSPEDSFLNQWNASFVSRTFSLSYTRRFGGKKKGIAKRATAAEEEIQRAQ